MLTPQDYIELATRNALALTLIGVLVMVVVFFNIAIGPRPGPRHRPQPTPTPALPTVTPQGNPRPPRPPRYRIARLMIYIIMLYWITASSITRWIIIGIVIAATWYLLDGRYSYTGPADQLQRIDHLTGEVCRRVQGAWGWCR